MARRKRKHVNLTQKLAATLACLLPQNDRDYLRSERRSAEFVIGLFNFDHNVLHALGGSDKWHNLTPMLVRPHREKSRRDTSIVAKVKRLQNAPTVAAGKPKPKVGGSAQSRAKRARNAPKSVWGRPGWRRKVNGEVVRTI